MDHPESPLLRLQRGDGLPAFPADRDRAGRRAVPDRVSDVQRSGDGTLVVIHDATLGRTARGPAASCTGVVRDKTLTQLKAWRAEIARSRNLPAYVVFHDATLEDMARVRPGSLAALGAISGVGAKKLEAYGADILRILA